MYDVVWPGGRLPTSERTLMMGIVNVTPDSFSDGGLYLDAGAAVKHAIQLAREGADILDVGGESTRPGAQPVSTADEIARVVPVIEGIVAEAEVPVSIDTMKSAVARAALDAGAQMINDVSAGRFSSDMFGVAAERSVPLVLMHMLGEPRTMQQDPRYGDVVGEVKDFLRDRARAASDAGIDPARIILDPGFGFGKTREQNLVLLKELSSFAELGHPILAGTSRKTFIGATLELPVEERLEGTAATVALAVANGADIVRVHDVAPMRRVVGMVEAVLRSSDPGTGAA